MRRTELYDAILYEMNKVEAPSLLLEGMNYFIKKGIQMYVNKKYNIFSMSQQTDDDLQWLYKTVTVPITGLTQLNPSDFARINLNDAVEDYMHTLSVQVNIRFGQNYKCYRQNEEQAFPAKRITADSYNFIMHNEYMRPAYNRPYYMTLDADRKLPELRLWLGRITPTSVYQPTAVHLHYLKRPQDIIYTDELLSNPGGDLDIDVEFPDYVALEIIREIVLIIQENASDPRTSSTYQVSQSIANPMAGGEK